MYAIIEDSGTQIKVSSDDVIDVDLRDLSSEPGSGEPGSGEPGSGEPGSGERTLTFGKVLVVGDAGSETAATIGKPYIEGASVNAEILDEVKGPKIHVVKFKRRKGYRVKTGHRQSALRVRITDINL